MKLILVVLVGMFFITPSFAIEERDCQNQLDQNPYQEIVEATAGLQAVSEANKKRVDLLKANITYSFVGVGVGKADIYLTEKDGKIVDLNVYAKVGVLGINEEIKQKVTLTQLKRGEPLEFMMNGADKPVLIIKPEADFDEEGGWATLMIWDGDRYQTEKIAMFKDGSKFKAFKDTIAAKNQITGLDVNMNGMSIPDMYVRRYKIKTRG